MNTDQLKEKYKKFVLVSDFVKAQKNAEAYLGKNAILKLSQTKNKKYDILNPSTGKYVSFGDIRYKDYTKTGDAVKRQSYLKRATKIKGDWILDRYSPNSLAINILWQ